ncbi:MAG: hypothetical protein ABJC33_05020 [Betaproteobacteria bacterium]
MPEPAIPVSAFPDPRIVRDGNEASTQERDWYALAASGLDASTGDAASRADAKLRQSLGAAIMEDAAAVDAAITGAPSPAIARQLWCQLDRAWRDFHCASSAGLAVSVFAFPLVVVAGVTAGSDALLPGVLRDTGVLAAILRSGRALAGNTAFALSNVLVAEHSLGVARLAQWDALRRLPPDGDAGVAVPQASSSFLVPAPIRVIKASESAHLRFLVGSALAAAGADLLAENNIAAWGATLTRELSAQMAAPGVSTLVLPRSPAPPLPAHHQGLSAQREASAQLFASHAIRKLRAAVGEPSAVISAHRCAEAPGGGELRLSLSSPFEPREAEGFRCPIYAIESVTGVVAMLFDLMRDCRVGDIRMLAGVHPDRAPGSSMPLLFKPETIPGGEGALLN